MDFSASERTIEVLILGGGPAGLSLGYDLQRHNVPFLILEQGETVGESWRNMPTALKLVSPWKSNRLPGTPKKFLPRHYQISRQEFFDYLQAYAEKHELPVRTGTRVAKVEITRDGLFLTHTSRGNFLCRFLVNATGCFCKPYVPDLQGARETRIPQIHSAGFKDGQQLAGMLGRREGLVLIVGKRLSAGQTMVALVDAGFDVALSHRSPIRFGAGRWGWWFLFRAFPWLEWVKLKCRGRQAPGNDVRMEGGRARRLIESGRVKTFPALRAFERDHVIFEDGRSLKPDLVLYATGFRPALDHLAELPLAFAPPHRIPQLRDLESVPVPGLFFIGLDHARNFQSRFLRGIRKDAAFLAGRLARRLESAAGCSRAERKQQSGRVVTATFEAP